MIQHSSGPAATAGRHGLNRDEVVRHKPAIRMGPLAVATDEQGKGHSQLLVGHVVNLAQQTRHTLGVRVLIVDAKDERAAAFYLSFGFRRTSDEGLSLYLTLPNPASDGG